MIIMILINILAVLFIPNLNKLKNIYLYAKNDCYERT